MQNCESNLLTALNDSIIGEANTPTNEIQNKMHREEKLNIEYLKLLQTKKARKDEYKRNKMRLTQMGTDLK